MLIKIKMTTGSTYSGKVPEETLSELKPAGFLIIEQSTGPILVNVANVVSITRAQ